MFIQQHSIDRVIEENDIVTIIERFCELKKAGANLSCKSPFVNEKTPSFMVSPQKGIFKCFSSGKGGDGIKFLMEHQNIGFIEAIKTAAEICNIHIEFEEPDPEKKRIIADVQAQKKLINNVANKYRRSFTELKANDWPVKMMKDRKYSADTIIEFGIGFAPNVNSFITNSAIENAQLETSKKIGISRSNDGVSYDFFRNRLMFPIQNIRGEVVGFGGRRSNLKADAKYAKYLNSTESDIYKKDRILYGLFQARKKILDNGWAILVEGYTDVIAMHQGGATQTVATCGTALTNHHAKELSRLCSHVVLFRDGDSAGVKAAVKDIDLLLQYNMKVSIVVLEEDQDPDSFVRDLDEDLEELITASAIDAIDWRVEDLKERSKEDPDKLAQAVDSICETLFNIKNHVKQDAYVKKISAAFRVKQGILKDALIKLEKDAMARAKKAASKGGSQFKNQELGLPNGANADQYLKDRFCIVGNTYYFKGPSGFFKGTNHVITPLFHIYGKAENKRLCEVVNELGHKRLIDFESKDFVNFGKLQEKLIEEGFFMWLDRTTNSHFRLTAQKILNDFITAYELKTLGWQNEGFFAYADGVYDHNEFKRVNKYGIIQIENELTKKEEYQRDVTHYYSPSQSEIYKSMRDDDDPYENDRTAIFKQSPIPIDHWMQKVVDVYGKKGNFGVSFVIATCFRDFVLSRYNFFPHLGGFGEKGSGKSKFGDSLQAFFYHKLAPFDLNSGTVVGFSRRLSRGRNTATMLEEYNDKIDDIKFQSMKGAYDGRGREKGQANANNRTTITNVNASIMYFGQYLPTRDDNSLASRTIINQFIKEERSTELIERYNDLKEIEEKGITSLITDVMKYRPQITNQFHKVFAELSSKIKIDLKNEEYEERMLQNYLTLLTPVKILFDKIKFPFEFNDFYEQCKDAIVDTSDLIIESEGLAEFWKALEYLLDKNVAQNRREFIIEKTDKVTITEGRGKREVWKNTQRDQILYLRLSKVHQDYNLHVSRMEGAEVIGQSTIRNYFKSKKYYIGPVKAKRFSESSSSCYAFNYTMMKDIGVLNLDRFDPNDILQQQPKEQGSGKDNIGDTNHKLEF